MATAPTTNAMADRYHLDDAMVIYRARYENTTRAYDREFTIISSAKNEMGPSLLAWQKGAKEAVDPETAGTTISKVTETFRRILDAKNRTEELLLLLGTEVLFLRSRPLPTYSAIDSETLDGYMQNLNLKMQSAQTVLNNFTQSLTLLHSHATNYINVLTTGSELSMLEWGLVNTTDKYSLYDLPEREEDTSAAPKKRWSSLASGEWPTAAEAAQQRRQIAAEKEAARQRRITERKEQ